MVKISKRTSKRTKLPNFPTKKTANSFVSREGVIKSIVEVTGIKEFNEGMVSWLRIPKYYSNKGLNGPCEFYDAISEQPPSGKPEDDPSYCFANGLPKPKWIEKWYLSIIKEKDNKLYLIYAEQGRAAFIKTELKIKNGKVDWTPVEEYLYDRMMNIEDRSAWK